MIKYLTLLPLLFILGCANAGTTATQIADLAITGYTAYAEAKSGQPLTAAQINTAVTSASNDLNGIAATAQAYVGKSVPVSTLVQGAASPAAASVVPQMTTPASVITQAQVDTLYQAAALVKK